MDEPPAEPRPETDESEAYRVLIARLGRRSPKIPADLLVRHVLRVVPPGEWPARSEALDALIRRLEFARRDGLRVDTRPEGGRALGPYSTRRREKSGARPYRTSIEAVDPIEARCDCPDFLKNSLGACKHVLAILEHLHAQPRLLKQALKEREDGDGLPTGPRWDPIRPLTGPGDWLDRVSLPASTEKARSSKRWERALARFRKEKGEDGLLVLKDAHPGDPPSRLAVVEDILPVVPADARSDPALRALLVGERERLRRLTKRALASAELRAAIGDLKRPLYPYQREGVERFLAAGRLLLADDMGLGKTAQAIACSEILYRSGRVRRGLVIAPASLKPQWAREWANFSDLPVRVIDGSPAERRELYEGSRSGFFIINYEQLIRDLEVVRRWGPDLVVLDEAQRIKNWATKTALSVKGLAPPYRLVLTGTPMENRIEELASVVEWVDDMALEPKWRLGPLHSILADGRREVTGVRHLDTLRQRLRGCMVRRVRQEVLNQLPPRTDTRVPIELTEAQLEEHDALNQPILQIVARARKRALTQAEFLRLMSLLTTQRIISNGLAQLQFEEVWPAIRPRPPEESVLKGLSAPKLLELRQLIRQLVLDQGRKVVVFSQWRRMLTLAHWAVSDLLVENGLRAGFFTGAEGQRRRTQNLVEFHDDPNHRLLFASDAGGVGLNLQKASNCVINVELPWNPAVLEQRIGRNYRLGQDQPIDVFNLVCEEGIESRIAGLVGSKQAFFKGLFDGDSDSVRFDQSGSFLSKVEKLVGPDEAPPPGGSGPTEADLLGPVDLGEVAAGDTDTDSDIDIDQDEAADPFEPILEAADESEDEPTAPIPSPEPDPEPEPIGASPPRPAAPSVGEVRRLFSQLEVRRQDDGKVVIEAPEEAASALGALFEGMAALLHSLSEPKEGDRP